MYRMLTPFPMDFPHTPQHCVIIDDVIIVDRRLLRTYITREARSLCKRVDVYMITVLCTWRIYALSECLLVLKQEIINGVTMTSARITCTLVQTHNHTSTSSFSSRAECTQGILWWSTTVPNFGPIAILDIY